MSQSNRPIVGINMDLHYPQKNKQGQLRLASGYCDRILEAGGLPIVMPAFTKDADLDAFLAMVDGMVMTGGADMDPRRNNQSMHPSVRMIPERREDSDRLLVRKLIETKKP
ncbi:MAG: gamma-glutamyl-gamma-aminobutyrate hydrolase family protein, partial [Gemmataceae bacterium]|nr:gamma-glutamyl-gamma-aminobutyrate hydrolase family protein [Gemmataceae bacterium]